MGRILVRAFSTRSQALTMTIRHKHQSQANHRRPFVWHFSLTCIINYQFSFCLFCDAVLILPLGDSFLLQVATTLVDILFIELMSHPSYVKQMYSPPMHLTHELIMCIQIPIGRGHFIGDSTLKSPCWHEFQACHLPTQFFFDLPPYFRYRILDICRPSAWLTCSQNNAWLWFLSAAPGVPKTSPIQVLSRPNIT